jgi:nitrate reductase assembly molybdenum cofactor insertion protein NarJ
MKYIFTLLFFLGSFQFIAQAQERDGERLEALKVAYLTKKLNLNTEEAQKFWPVYNEYIADMKKVRQENRGGDELKREEKLLEVRKKYQASFSKALSADRANQFFKAEKEFYSYVQKELQERRQQRQDNRARFRDN